MLQRIWMTLRGLVMWLFILLGFALALNTFTYLNFDRQFGFLKLKEEAIATGWYLPFYYSHVLVGGLILICGFVQFNTKIRSKWRKLHRVIGYMYVMGILLFAAPGGMVMSFFIGRGPLVLASFVVQCSLWFYATSIAFREIRKEISPCIVNG
jgi:hypothetical protein